MAKVADMGRAPARVAFWNDPAYRSIFFQALTLALIVAFGWYIVGNTVHNLEKAKIASGFGFLSTTAGFGISVHLIPYDVSTSTYGDAFLVGLINTLVVSALGILLATMLGFVVGIMRLSRNWLVARLAGLYVETLRNIPLLLQMFFWYFAVLRALPSPRAAKPIGESIYLTIRGLYVPRPVFGVGFGYIVLAAAVAIVAVFVLRRWAHRRQMRTGQRFPVLWTSLVLLFGLPAVATVALIVTIPTGLPLHWEAPVLAGFNFRGGLVLQPEFVALLAALSFYTATFIAEIVRAGILAVSHGQTEAAYALGLSPGLTLRLVVVPQALRVIIPPLTSQYLNLTKNSSLAVAIGYPDLVSVFAGTVLNQTGQAIEVLSITMAVYLTISLAISLYMNWYNKRIALVER